MRNQEDFFPSRGRFRLRRQRRCHNLASSSAASGRVRSVVGSGPASSTGRLSGRFSASRGGRRLNSDDGPKPDRTGSGWSRPAARRARQRGHDRQGREAEDERSIPIQRAGNARLSPAFVIIGQHGRSERIEITQGATRGRRLARDRIRLPPAPRLPSVRACEHDTPRPCKHDGQNGDDHPAKLVPTGDHCKHLITTWADDATTGRSERLYLTLIPRIRCKQN